MTRDLRKYARQTNFRLIIGGLLFAIVIGLVLIYVIYGPEAAVSGALCMCAGLSPMLLIFGAFIGIDLLVKWYNQE